MINCYAVVLLYVTVINQILYHHHLDIHKLMPMYPLSDTKFYWRDEIHL